MGCSDYVADAGRHAALIHGPTRDNRRAKRPSATTPSCETLPSVLTCGLARETSTRLTRLLSRHRLTGCSWVVAVATPCTDSTTIETIERDRGRSFPGGGCLVVAGHRM